jgi:hypothetical protein
MRCPSCDYSNPPDSEFCTHCNEVLLHNATKGLLRHILRQKRRKETYEQEIEKKQQETLQTVIATGKRVLRKSSFLVPLGLGVFVIVAGIVHYQSPLTHLKLYGTHLSLMPPQGQPINYLEGLDCKAELWTERDGRPDAPLVGTHLIETGSINLTAGPAWKEPREVQVRVSEWARSLQRAGNPVVDTIPANHPSIAPAMILLDPQGTVVERQTADHARLGRALAFLFPRFPKGALRPGSSWEENVEWHEGLGKWTINYQGTAHWLVKGYEPCQGGACVRLTCEVQMDPTVIQSPGWVITSSVTAKTTEDRLIATGEAVYDSGQKALDSFSLSYQTTITIPSNRLEDIDWEERSSDAVLQGPGLIRMRLTEHLDIRKT